MFTAPNTSSPEQLAREVSHGTALAQELYRKACLFINWFQQFVKSGRGGRTPQQAIGAFGVQAARWMSTVEIACEFVNAANKLDGQPADVSPLGAEFIYTKNADGTVSLTVPGGTPQAINPAAAPAALVITGGNPARDASEPAAVADLKLPTPPDDATIGDVAG